MYNLIEYNNNYSKASERLWQYYRDKLVLDLDPVANFHATDNLKLNKSNRCNR